MDDLLDEFLEETNENLDALSNDLVAWEKSPADRSLFDGIFRFFHTIKGNSGFLELERLGRLSHAAESALVQVRDKGVVPDSGFVSAVFAAIDEIRLVMAGLAETRAEPAGNDAALIGRLEAATIIAPGRPESGAALEPGATSGEKADRVIAAGGAKANAGSVRVSIGLLDHLMGIASELVLARNALLRSVRHNEELPANLIEHVSTCVTDLQDGINRTRMQPMEALWTPLPRLVRELGRELSKDIELVLEGGDTEIDRQLFEAIRDPIVHMVRNAADHGIENAEVRRRTGKPPKGTIRLAALQSGGHIHIELSDDGRGIDPDRLRARAISMGLLEAAEAEALSESAAQALIFEPGLSTAAAVTSISGRGVGMDVVRSNLERIGGSVEVRSRVGHGSTFLIRVPLTLTIVPALIVGIEGRSYGIGQSSIREIVRLKDLSALKMVGGRAMIELRETLIPVIDVAAMFGDAAANAERWGVIIDAAGVGRVVLLVDAVSDQEEIVIKPVSPLIAAAGVYAGATVLGSGEAALVLDLPGLVARAGVAAGATIEEASAVDDGAIDASASWMLIETDDGPQKALPLALIARIEGFDPARVSLAGGHWMLHHDGQLLPLNSFDGDPEGELALILDDGRRRAALAVKRVVDIVTSALTIEHSAITPGIAGVAVMDGRSVELVDAGWLMTGAGTALAPVRGSILIVGNRQFATGLLKPLLESAGHSAFIAADDAEAKALAERGMKFDLILADDAASPPKDISPVTLRLGGASDAERGKGIDPYDRAGLLEAVNGSLRRGGGVLS